MSRHLLACFAVVVAAGCAGSAPPTDHRQREAVPQDRPLVLLISIDGFRADFVDMHDAPTIRALARKGVRAEGLVPVFPTTTFPNHYSIVTGLYPVQHGIVGNRFYDPDLDRSFRYTDPADAADSLWWGGEPIWVTAARNGLTSAVYFWPGSETIVNGRRPSYWYPYDSSVPGAERIDQVLQWLEMKAPDRPSFLALYFSLVDKVSHEFGPGSAQTRAAVSEIDGLVARLVTGLTLRGLLDDVNIILVSDHGQADRSPERVIYLEDYIDLATVRLDSYGPSDGVWPIETTISEVLDRLQDAHPHLSVFSKETLPERWKYRGSARIAPVLIIADEGWTFGRRQDDNPAWHRGGDHGYDPALPSMHGLFVAHGPAFAEGVVLPPFENIHVYPLMADILRIEPAPNQGSLSTTDTARAAAGATEVRSK